MYFPETETAPDEFPTKAVQESLDKETIEIWKNFFATFSYKSAINLAKKDKQPLKVYWNNIADFKTDLGLDLASRLDKDPERTLWLGRCAAKEFAGDKKDKISLQIVNRSADSSPDKLTALQAHKLVTFEGLVTSTSNARPKIINAVYQCARCLAIVKEPLSNMESRRIPAPLECYRDQGGCGKQHTSTRFNLIREKCDYIDTQFAEIVNRKTRKGISCSLPTLLIDSIEVGQTVKVTGINTLAVPERADGIPRWYVSVNSIENILEDIQKPSNEKMPDIKSAIAPGITGIDAVKEAIILQLFGGVPREDFDHYARGDIHILLFGKPGAGKSTLLKSAMNLAPVGTYAPAPTYGIEGLIGEVVDNGGWYSVKGGEITLNTGGLLCIDDVDAIKDKVSAFFEPLEHQTVTLRARGYSRRLPAKCSVLAAGIEKQVSEPFRQRFDCIFKIDSASRVKGGYKRPSPETLEEIRNYISYARTINPVLRKDERDYLNTIDYNWRELNKVQRLAEASARKRLSNVVEGADIEYAHKIIESAVSSEGK